MTRLPTPGGDSGNWGSILNDFLAQVHASDGTLKTDSVTSDAIAPNAVTSAAIAPNSITNTALASNAVDAAIIQDGSITNALIADGAIEEAKLSTAVQAKLNQTAPVTSVASKTGDVTLTKSDVGLSNVDNTSDANKPISFATQAALDTKQTLSTAPAGYIRVPGNSKFGTTDFYVMKYQAKNDGNNNAISIAAGTPWVSISQLDASDKARAVGSGYHLITEAEWMTIATDILYEPSNWTSGVVGTGQLYRGHSDNNPSNSLEASTNDSDGYYGTGNSASDGVGTGKEQRRTFTLSNGEVIWDFAGNVWEWTDAWILGRDQPTVESSNDTATSNFAVREWTAINKRIGALSYAIPTNRSWNSSQGLGKIQSADDTVTSNSNTAQYGFLRGGQRIAGSTAGVFALNLTGSPTFTGAGVGFRVCRYL